MYSIYIYILYVLMWIRGYQLGCVSVLGLYALIVDWRLGKSQRRDMRFFSRTCAVMGSWAKGAERSIPLAAGWLTLDIGNSGDILTWCPFAPPTSGQLCCSGVRVQSTFQTAVIRYRILQISWYIIQCRRLAKSTDAHATEFNRCLHTLQTLSNVA